MPSTSQNQDALLNHLKEQIFFLQASSSSYDRGFMSEAKRLAVVIRVLVHDTPKSQSLLSQMDKKGIPFLTQPLPTILAIYLLIVASQSYE